MEAGDLLAQMEEDCKPVMDMVTDMATGLLANSGDLADFDPDEDMFGEDGELGKLGKKCLKSLFGDNAIGNYVRYEWNNFDKVSTARQGSSLIWSQSKLLNLTIIDNFSPCS